MELAYFNVNDGFLEGILRGFRSGFLGPEDYRRLATCDTLEDVRTALDDSDYGSFMQDEPSPILVQSIVKKCKEKLAEEFRFMRCQAVQPLLGFLDFVATEKMIDNVCTLIQGTVSGKEPKDLLARVEPLGWFEEMKVIPSMDVSAGYDDVYRTILIDTPVGPFFEKFLHGEDGQKSAQEMQRILTETDLEIMKNVLKKLWLEDFYSFCQAQGGTTAEVMGHILMMEADFRTLAVTVNSLNTDLGSNQQDRSALYPNFGYLYPEGTNRLRKAFNESTVRAALEPYGKYLQIFDQCRAFYDDEARKHQGDKARSLEDLFFTEMAKEYELCFEQQFHYGVFYAWVKLREQEVRNLEWISNMILMNRKERFDDIVALFNPRN